MASSAAEGALPSGIQTLAVIGAGRLGRVFALAAARAGFAVVLEDVMPANLRRAQDEYAELLSDNPVGSMRYALTVEDAVREADIAVDFVPDELESKLEIFSLLDRMAPPRTVLCTPTRALSVTDLASCTYRAERCLGVRGQHESLLGGQIELVQTASTDARVLEAAQQFWRKLSSEVHIVLDSQEPMLMKNAR